MIRIALLSFILFACQSGGKKLMNQRETVYVELNSVLPANDTLIQIRELCKKVDKVVLPYQYLSASPNRSNIISAHSELDKMIFGKNVPCSIIGLLPDTSNYFAFLYLKAADSELPSIITYDKNGKLILDECLVESCWQGCESDCRFELDINKLLDIQLKYEYYLYDVIFDDNDEIVDCSSLPISANGFIRKSRLTSAGKIIISSTDSLSIAELMKNPIIHQFE